MSYTVYKRFFKCCILISVLSGVPLLLTACGKQAEQDPPKAKSDLLLEIFSALDKQDYDTALAKVEKMRTLDKTSVFLSELEHVERNNKVIQKADAKMRQGRFNEAEDLLKEAIQNYGEQPDLTTALRQIASLKILNDLTDRMLAPENAGSLSSDALKMLEHSKENPVLQNFAKQKLIDAKKLDLFEADRALFSLYIDINEQFNKGEYSRAAVLCAIQEIEKPEYPRHKALFTKIRGL